MKRYRTIALLIALLMGTACNAGDEEEDDFSETSPMYAIQQEGVLRVAVPDNVPPFAADGDAGHEGFVVDLAHDVAADLGVEVETIPAESTEMGRLVADEIVDVGFPLTPLTYDALRVKAVETGYAFASPFFVAHQRLLVPEASGIEQLSDLEGGRICSFIDEDTQVDVSRLVDARVDRAATPKECETALRRGDADAVTASNALLASMAINLEDAAGEGSGSYVVVGDQLNTEGYAAMTLPGPMASYLIGELSDIEEAGRWMELYDRWLAPYLGPVDAPPELTLQDAASLYPPSDS